MFGAECLFEVRDHMRVDRSIRHRHGQLVALPLVMQRRGTLQPRAVAGEAFDGELLRCLLRERVPCGGDLAEIGLSQQAAKCAGIVMFDVCVEQPERREQSSRRRHDDAADAERRRHAGGEQRPIAAESEQRELARVAPALG